MKDKKRVSNVLNALNETRIFNELLKDDSLYDLFEDSEYKPIGEQKIDERSAVTFGGKANPRDGWACIMAGGPGLI